MKKVVEMPGRSKPRRRQVLAPARLRAAFRKLNRRARGLALRVQAAIYGGTVGPRIEVERGVCFRSAVHPGVTIGSDVYLGIGVVIDVPPGGMLEVGNRCKVMHYTVIAASQRVTFGDDTQIAEHCSIRDSDHSTASGQIMSTTPVLSKPVSIGSNVWIARGVGVLMGSRISNGAVIGANSLVKGEIPEETIAFGIPAKPVRGR